MKINLKHNQNSVKLKPVVYSESNHSKEKLRKIIETKNVAQLYQTLDKIAMRKGYHEALARNGISFDFLVGGISKIATDGEKDGDRLKAYQTLLKSVGMDKYDSVEGSSGTWEEVLLSKIEEEKVSNTGNLNQLPEYEVIAPELPESAKRQQEEEKEVTGSIYDNN